MHIRPDDCSVAAAVFGSLINVIVVVFPSWSVKDNQFCVPHDKVIRKSHQKLKKSQQISNILHLPYHSSQKWWNWKEKLVLQNLGQVSPHDGHEGLQAFKKWQKIVSSLAWRCINATNFF